MVKAVILPHHHTPSKPKYFSHDNNYYAHRIYRYFDFMHTHTYYIADCGVPLVSDDILLSYNSTLENAVLEIGCRRGLNKLTPDPADSILSTAVCHRNATWIPRPADHVCTTTSTHDHPLGKLYKYFHIILY